MTMATAGQISEFATRPRVRAALSDLAKRACHDAGAESYMLVSLLPDQRGDALRIIASNWIYDAIELVGRSTLAKLAKSRFATPVGGHPHPISTLPEDSAGAPLSRGEARKFNMRGHSEIHCLKLNAGKHRPVVLLSDRIPGRMNPAAVTRAQMIFCHALSAMPELLSDENCGDPLSDRERECLYWVSEGKTTEEVALILGVSSNTVSSYIAHAIRKFAAPNRAMAVATAIRSGII